MSHTPELQGTVHLYGTYSICQCLALQCQHMATNNKLDLPVVLQYLPNFISCPETKAVCSFLSPSPSQINSAHTPSSLSSTRPPANGCHTKGDGSSFAHRHRNHLPSPQQHTHHQQQAALLLHRASTSLTDSPHCCCPVSRLLVPPLRTAPAGPLQFQCNVM
jgi:hypothetical protein